MQQVVGSNPTGSTFANYTSKPMSRALCLNVTYEPIGFLPKDRAVCLFLEGKIDILERSEKVYRSPRGVTVPDPVVVRLNSYVKVPRQLKEAITSNVLFARDKHTCQYCGVHRDDLRGKRNRLTIDHIKPRAQGGPHHWENVVTCCYICNIKKRDRTPLQANMKFVHLYKNRSPKKPSQLMFSWGGRINEQQLKWIKAYYKIDDLNTEFEWTEKAVA